jgi:hypothetical protein
VKTYCVYCLERFEGGAFLAFYVGYTGNPRRRKTEHKRDRRRNHHGNLIRKVIRAIGHLPMQIVASGLTEDEAKRLEVEMIAAFRQYGIPITNRTAGGDFRAPPTPEIIAKRVASRAGYRHSAETKAKMSASSTGKMHSPETRAKLRAINKGRKGTPLTSEQIPALKAPQVRAKRSAALKAHYSSTEASDRVRRSRADPETRVNRSLGLKTMWADPQVNERHLAAIKAANARPEVRAKRVAAINRTETKAKQRASATGRKQSPETIAKRIAHQIGKQFLDVAIAQGEAEIKPNCVLDDARREAVAAV